MKKRYYLDHNATTPIRPEVLDAMIPYMKEIYGNPSSVHWYGQAAKNALEMSREKIAAIIGADAEEVFFTGCGTESDNIALTGYMNAIQNRNGLVTTKVEHSAILKTAAQLEKKGVDVTYIGVDNQCVINLDELSNAVSANTALVSIMHANNETGVLQPIKEAAKIAHDAGAVFHTDAVQSTGKIHIDVREMDIDMLSMSAHKINAPKGVGAIYIKKGIDIEPLTYGGSHERGIRPGTENVAGIVGLTKALELYTKEREERALRLSILRDRLETAIEKNIPNILFNGRDVLRLPGTSNISFPDVDGEALLFSMDLEGAAVSTGSACTTGEVEPSHVLIAMGIMPNVAQSSIRFSLGWGNTEEDIDHVITVLPSIIQRLRKISGRN
ncbi:cysteine desulfurase family protein [Candidatus Latescibacterota bacterium]